MVAAVAAVAAGVAAAEDDISAVLAAFAAAQL